MPRIATVDKMVEVIRHSEQPVLTKTEIAEGIDVSWQTIKNHEDELQNDPRVEFDKVGKAMVYWLADQENSGSSENAPQNSEATEYHPLERAAFYTGFISVTFALLLSLVYLTRLTFAAMIQSSLSPSVPVIYYILLAASALLFIVAWAMALLVRSGRLRGWTGDLTEDVVENKFSALKATWKQRSVRLMLAYLGFSTVATIIEAYTLPIPRELFFWPAVFLVLPLFVSCLITLGLYILHIFLDPFSIYQRFLKPYLPEPMPSATHPNSQSGDGTSLQRVVETR